MCGPLVLTAGLAFHQPSSPAEKELGHQSERGGLQRIRHAPASQAERAEWDGELLRGQERRRDTGRSQATAQHQGQKKGLN